MCPPSWTYCAWAGSGCALAAFGLFQQRVPEIVLDMVSAEYADPQDGFNWTDDIALLLGGEPWHGGISVGVTEPECDMGLGFECGESPRALELGGRQRMCGQQ